jgi:hypothetical protein
VNWASDGCAGHCLGISHLTIGITVEHEVLGLVWERIGSGHCMITSVTLVKHLIAVAVVKRLLALHFGLIQKVTRLVALHLCAIETMAG